MLPADRVDRRTSGAPAARRTQNVRIHPPARRGPPPTDSPHAVELAGLLHELTAELLAAADTRDALHRLAGFARQALPSAARCSATLVGDGLPLIHAAAGAALPGLDDPHAEGPGVEAARTRALVTTPDLGADPRWPALAAVAPADGVSAAALPLDVHRQSVGALRVYVARRDGLDPGLLLTAMALAGQAEVLLGEVLRRAAQAEQAADLISTLRAGAVVHHALGVIIAQRGCDLPEAYAFLHETAQRLGLAPAAVAEKIVAAAARR